MNINLKYINRAQLNGGAITQEDYIFLTLIVKANKWKGILEFGPGASTWAFLENNCVIDSLEHNEKWLMEHARATAEFHREGGRFGNIRMFKYLNNGEPINVPGVNESRYDFAFVDAPPGKPEMSRWVAMEYCIQRTNVIAIHDSNRKGEKETLEKMKELGWTVQNLTNIGRGIGLCYRKPFKELNDIIIPVKTAKNELSEK